jgi:6,7-dimethyl-8-ribityllumazine synthase
MPAKSPQPGELEPIETACRDVLESLQLARLEWSLEAALAAAESGVSGVVSIGCILQGATTHAQQLSTGVASALSDLTLRPGVPRTWGVLTCATQEEAIERAGRKLGNKGEEAALAAIEAASVRAKLRR